MKVYNIKTKLLTPSNTINEKKLYSILNKNISNNKPFQLTNKTKNTAVNNVFDIELNGNKYLLKTLQYSQLTDNEISNMTRINRNSIVKPYILECKYLVKTTDSIVSIFENIDSILITDFINNINKIKDKETHNKLKRYLIISLLKAISDLHNVNICHLNINVNNILVNMNPLYNSEDVYSTEMPLIIKFINFNLKFNNRKKDFILSSKLSRLDPYINYKQDNMLTLEEGKKYDLWCIGLIILKVILASDIYYSFIERIISLQEVSKPDIQLEFNIIYVNLVKYTLTDLKQRETGDFILNKIILDEKHN
jgi:serine/threonine protein kinase